MYTYDDIIKTETFTRFDVDYVKLMMLNKICTLHAKNNGKDFVSVTNHEKVNVVGGVCTSVADNGDYVVITNMQNEHNKWNSHNIQCYASKLCEEDISCLSTDNFNITIASYKDLVKTVEDKCFNIKLLTKDKLVTLRHNDVALSVKINNISATDIEFQVDKRALKLFSAFLNKNVNSCNIRSINGMSYITANVLDIHKDIVIEINDKVTESDSKPTNCSKEEVAKMLDNLSTHITHLSSTSDLNTTTHTENIDKPFALCKSGFLEFKRFRPDILKQFIGKQIYITRRDHEQVSGVLSYIANDNSSITLKSINLITLSVDTISVHAIEILENTQLICIVTADGKLDTQHYYYNDFISTTFNNIFNVDKLHDKMFVDICSLPDSTVTAFIERVDESTITLVIDYEDIAKLNGLCVSGVNIEPNNTSHTTFGYRVTLTPDDFGIDVDVALNTELTTKEYTLYEALNMFLRGYKIRATEWKDNDYIFWDNSKLQIRDNYGKDRPDLSILSFNSWKIVGRITTKEDTSIWE